MTHPIPSMIYVVLSQYGEVLDCGSKTRTEAVEYACYLHITDRIAAFDARDFSATGAASLRDVTEEIVREAYDAGYINKGDSLVGEHLGIYTADDIAATKDDFDRDMRLAGLMMGDAA